MLTTIDFGIYKNLEWEKLSTEYLQGLADMGNKNAQDQLTIIYDFPIEKQKIGFGKFSGLYWIHLDVEYLAWIRDTIDTNDMKHKLATKALSYIQKQHKQNDEEFIDVIYVD